MSAEPSAAKFPRSKVVADVSTAHITASDNELLLSAKISPVFYGRYEYGYLLPTIVPDDTEAAGRARSAGYSPALVHLMMQARRDGCYYLKLDCDGPVIEGLRTHDW